MPSNIIAQNSAQDHVLDSIKCIIEDSRDRGDFEGYYGEVRGLEEYFVLIKKYENIYSTNTYYNFLPENKNDSLLYRRSMMYHGHKLKKYLDDFYGALPYYLKANEYASNSILLDKWAHYIENVVGSIYARLNEYDKAIFFYESYIPYLNANNELTRLSTLYSSIGNCYRWLGNSNKMHDAFQKSINIGYENDAFEGLQSAHSNLASFYSELDSSDLFIDHLNKSFSFLEKINSNRYAYKYKSELHEIKGDYFRSNGLIDSALMEYSKAIFLLKENIKSKQNRKIAKLYTKVGLVHLKHNDLQKCNASILNGFGYLIPDFITEVPLENQIIHENTFTDLLDVKASYYVHKYILDHKLVYLDSALLSLDLGIYANDQLDKNLILNNSKYKSIESNKKLIDHAINICYIAIHDSIDLFEKVRNYIDLSKGLLLIENQKNKLLLEKLSSADLDQLSILELQLINFHRNKSDNTSKSKDLQKNILKCHEEIKSLLGKYPSDDIFHEELVGPYLEYIETDNSIYLFTNHPYDQLIKLNDKSEITSFITKVNSLISDKGKGLNHALSQLNTMLIPIDISKAETISIIPDGAISFVPFDILRRNNRYLMEDHIINVQMSRIQIVRKKSFDNKLYCLNPSYPIHDSGPEEQIDRGSIVRLPNSYSEVQSISKYYGTETIIDSSYDVKQLKQRLSGTDMFHFAGHAIIKGDSAYLVLIDKNGDVEKLTHDQIMYLSNDLKMVTLSACETGLGTFKQGEGVRSLASSFMHSGANAITYSLWNANDKSTSIIMELYYKFLDEGKKKDVALNKAKKEYLKLASPAFKHPYYWASFVVAGDTQQLKRPNNFKWIWMIFTFLSLLIILYLYIKPN